MTLRDEVNYVEQMNPSLVEAAAEDFKRVVRLIDSALSVYDEVKGKTDWQGDAKDLLDRRLKEADSLLEALRHEYDRAGRALDDYHIAQLAAKRLVDDGIRAEQLLGDAISHIDDPGPQPMRKWDDMKGTDGFFDWLGELGSGDEVDAVRALADRLYGEASDYYSRAKKTETDARSLIVAALVAARRGLPDFQADARHAQEIIAGVPGMREETLQAARDPNARRPGQIIMGEYQVAEDFHTEMFPGAPYNWIVDGETVTASEAALLRELQERNGIRGLLKFEHLKEEAFAVADQQIPIVTPDGLPNGDRNNDHNDAFRHAYWNARLTQEFGEDWTRRFATAHESAPGNEAPREAMDLYNNEVGRSIATSHPDASPEELARLVRAAVESGDTVVISSDGTQLEYSDQIRPEETGDPQKIFLPGHPQPAQPGTGS